MLKKDNRIQSKRLIAKLFKDGKVYKDRTFVFRYLSALTPPSEFVIIISKKAIKRAVQRNHLKRQISSLLRKYLNLLEEDIVALVLPKAYNQPIEYKDLEKGILNFINYLSKTQGLKKV